MTNSKSILSIILCVFLLSSCSKNPIVQLNFAAFTASVNGVHTEFMAPVTAQSVPNTNGGADLVIQGENRVTNDSSVRIRFIIPDFTFSTTKKVTYSLNTNFNGHFIEWKSTPGSTNGQFHFFQQGNLTVEQDARGYLKGSFNFVYFLFDKQANKLGEVTVNNGQFADIIIER